MTGRGHNENTVRLAALAGDAQVALDKVARGESDASDGWLAYGAALNEGRALHTSENGVEDDRGFGGWIKDNHLSQLGQDEVHPKEREAAMWAAANADQFEEARAAGNARTIRGIHAKWKEIEAEREKAKRDEERKAKEEADRKERAARAEAARKDAEEKAQAEADARKAAKEAKDEKARVDAEARAEEAAAASKEAAQKADDADQAAQAPADEPEPEPTPDPYGYAKLTEEALLEQANGLRADLDDERERRKAAEAERDRFKEANRDLSQSNQGATISRLKSQIQAMKYARDEAMSATKREEYKRKKAEAELKRLTGQEVEI